MGSVPAPIMPPGVVMSLSFSVPKWLHLPSRIAVLLGFGALSAAAAQANATGVELGSRSERVPQQSAKSFGELRIWTEAGRIYVSENGKAAQELRLGDTPQAHRLREVLERDGADANSPRVLPDRIILVGGGGAGFDWAPADRNRTSQAPGAPPATSFGSTNPGAPPQTTPPASSRLPGKMSPRPTDKG
jgi:hypothetical protein